MCADAHGDQKRVLDPLGLELWADVSFLTGVLGAKLRYSANALHTLTLFTAEPSLQSSIHVKEHVYPGVTAGKCL